LVEEGSLFVRYYEQEIVSTVVFSHLSSSASERKIFVYRIVLDFYTVGIRYSYSRFQSLPR